MNQEEVKQLAELATKFESFVEPVVNAAKRSKSYFRYASVDWQETIDDNFEHLWICCEDRDYDPETLKIPIGFIFLQDAEEESLKDFQRQEAAWKLSNARNKLKTRMAVVERAERNLNNATALAQVKLEQAKEYVQEAENEVIRLEALLQSTPPDLPTSPESA